MEHGNTITEIARLVKAMKSGASIHGYSGQIIGEKFDLTVRRGWLYDGLKATLNFDGGQTEEFIYDSFSLNTDLPFGGKFRFSYNAHLQNRCTIAYNDDIENFARVVSAVVYMTYRASDTGPGS